MKKNDEAAILSQRTKQGAIPFVKPARVGNFKIWRGKVGLEYLPELTDEQKKLVEEKKAKVKKQKVDIECINVSNLEGSWLVRVPQTFEMFGMITLAYSCITSDNASANDKAKAEDFLRTALSNMMYVSAICNGFYHNGVQAVTSAYAHPDILRDDEKRKVFMKDMADLVESFLAWRAEYDQQENGNEPSAQELHQEDIAEGAMNVLQGE